MSGPSRTLVVRTTREFSASVGVVWPLLCSAKMDRSSSLLFRLGVPQPIECRLPGGRGGVGEERECVSVQGIVHQKILVWEPEARLAFRMERADLPAVAGIVEIEDSVQLTPTKLGVQVTRTTSARVAGKYGLLRRIALRLGLKQVHRYVFRNWKRLAEGRPEDRSGHQPTATGSP